MKQLLQDLRAGTTDVAEVPTPAPGWGKVLIQSRTTLVSAGTERMLVEFGRASLLGKARAQPEKVKQVLDKIRADGLLPTTEAVFKRLGEPLPLGYCNAGVVLEVGSGVTDLQPGDRVASNGPHAEIVAVPRNLCAKIPDSVTDEQAAFTVLASIGLQGIRLAAPTLGERFVVYGLGLIGLVTVQLLRANGCEVLGIDLDPARLKLAEQFGAKAVPGGEGVVAAVNGWTGGQGADAVLITASAKTDDIVHQAAEMSRKRGRIVLVGVVGLNLRRADFYEKELTFQVSCSYGPGRYDDAYEQGGRDYPLPYVRWTEQRNFEAVLGAMARAQLVVDPLISKRVPIAEAPKAYEELGSGVLGIILQYPEKPDTARAVRVSKDAAPTSGAGRAVVGVVGAGNFGKMTLMPGLAKTSARVKYVCDLNGAAAWYLAKRFGAEMASSELSMLLDDAEVNTVILAVGHHLHAKLVCEALAAGKHVMVEKPLAIDLDGLRQVIEAAREHGRQQLLVGFNRRFSPHIVRMRELLGRRGEPLAMSMMVNAGAIPAGHWVQDPERGGGRIIGEACHFIDLMVHLSGSLVKTVSAAMVGSGPAVREDKMAIVLGFADGSIGTVNYFANGAKTYPKETLEVFSDGRVLRLENFRKLEGHGLRLRTSRSLQQDKGHAAELAAFVARVASGGPPLIPLAELVNVTLASFAAVTAARESRTVDLASEYPDLLAAKAG